MENLTFKMDHAILESMFPYIVEDDGNIMINQKIALFRSGSALYYRGKGMWTISGYMRDGSDVDDAINELLQFRRNIRRNHVPE